VLFSRAPYGLRAVPRSFPARRLCWGCFSRKQSRADGSARYCDGKLPRQGHFTTCSSTFRSGVRPPSGPASPRHDELAVEGGEQAGSLPSHVKLARPARWDRALCLGPALRAPAPRASTWGTGLYGARSLRAPLLRGDRRVPLPPQIASDMAWTSWLVLQQGTKLATSCVQSRPHCPDRSPKPTAISEQLSPSTGHRESNAFGLADPQVALRERLRTSVSHLFNTSDHRPGHARRHETRHQ
jgi:hypothetical protein